MESEYHTHGYVLSRSNNCAPGVRKTEASLPHCIFKGELTVLDFAQADVLEANFEHCYKGLQ